MFVSLPFQLLILSVSQSAVRATFTKHTPGCTYTHTLSSCLKIQATRPHHHQGESSVLLTLSLSLFPLPLSLSRSLWLCLSLPSSHRNHCRRLFCLPRPLRPPLQAVLPTCCHAPPFGTQGPRACVRVCVRAPVPAGYNACVLAGQPTYKCMNTGLGRRTLRYADTQRAGGWTQTPRTVYMLYLYCNFLFILYLYIYMYKYTGGWLDDGWIYGWRMTDNTFRVERQKGDCRHANISIKHRKDQKINSEMNVAQTFFCKI